MKLQALKHCPICDYYGEIEPKKDKDIWRYTCPKCSIVISVKEKVWEKPKLNGSREK